MADLPADRWRRADQVFEAALDLPPDERSAYLDRTCAGDPELRALVGRLLANADADSRNLASGGALGGALWGEAARDLAGDDEGPTAGKLIGRYRILKEIGRGGMAVVYLAERADGQFEQKVALKRIKRGVDTDEVLLRFDQERQILALARHPNIGQLLDGGVDEEGRPYFAMEHVEGRPIDRYCDEQKLSVPERLRLFIQIARAVGYAHRNLVVHRDLKPSNILVSDDGVVKLLDFGIAKLLDADAASAATPLTRTYARPMTPVYASPEQIQGGPVTTASDIYQLGLLLYEILSGCYPYRLAERSPNEAVRAICETDPTRPSNAVLAAAGHAAPGTGGAPPTAEAIGRARKTSPERLRRELAGDLDNIVLMALRKEPERRYGSAAQLVEDIERYLDGRPVRARPNTFAYRTGKLLRRHRVAAVTAAAALVLIVALVVFYTVRLTRERDRAQLAAAEANQVAAFLRGLFRVSAPTRSLGETVTARDLLDRGAHRIETELAGQPEVQASMMTVIGEVYSDLAFYEEAAPLLERAVELGRSGADAGGLGLADSLHELAKLRLKEKRLDETDELLEETLAIRHRLLGPDDPEVARTMETQATLREGQGEYEEALRLHRQAADILGATLGPLHPDVGESLVGEARALQRLEKYTESVEVLQRALEIFESGRTESPASAEVHTLLGESRRHLGDPEGALAEFESSLPRLEKVYGADHPEVANALDRTASTLNALDRLDQAISMRERALAIRTRIFGRQHPAVAATLNNLGRSYERKRDRKTALELYRESAAILEATLGPDHHNTLVALGNVASILRLTGELEAAAELYRRIIAGYEQIYGPEAEYLNQPLAELGKIELARDRPQVAEPLLRRALALGRNEGSSRFPEIVRPRIDLGRCLTRLGRFGEAEQILRLNLEEGDLDRGSGIYTHQALVELYQAWDRPRDAGRHQKALEELRSKPAS